MPSHHHSHFIKFYVQQQWCKVCVQVCAKKQQWKKLSIIVGIIGVQNQSYATKEYMSNQTSHHFSIMVPLWHFTFGTSPMVVGKWPTCHSMDKLSTIMPWELICPSKSGPKWWGFKKHWKWIVSFGWPINICPMYFLDSFNMWWAYLSHSLTPIVGFPCGFWLITNNI